MTITITRTGVKTPFLDLGIGSPFFAHGRVWVRTDYDAATEFHSSNERCASCCNFLIDGKVRSERHNAICEEVEEVKVEGGKE